MLFNIKQLLKFIAGVICGIAPVALIVHWLGMSVADLIFFTGAFAMIHWGYKAACRAEDPRFLEEKKTSRK